MADTAPVIHRTQVGPVRTFTVDLQEPVTGALVFRVGVADESLGSRGITHIVEHLALYAAEKSAGLTYNGFVDLDRTMLWARGPRPDVLRFLEQVARAIGALPLDRLEDERRVLRTEANESSATLVERLLRFRFGTHGYGLANVVEKGLGWVDRDAVQDWSNRKLCAENAVCLLTTSPPSDFVIPLPRGEAAGLPPLDTLPDMQFPAQVRDGIGGVSLTQVVERSWATTAALAIAAKNLNDQLRLQRAITYNVTPGYLRLGANHAHLTLSAGCLTKFVDEIQTALLRETHRLATEGPAEGALAEWQHGWSDWKPQPDDLARAELDRIATNVLLGRNFVTFAELHAEREALTTSDVASAMADAPETSLLLVPQDVGEQPFGFSVYEGERLGVPQGRSFRFKGSGLNSALRRRRVVIADDRICLIPRTGDPVTIRFDDIVGVERLADGSMTFHGRHGTWLRFDPAQLNNSSAAVDAIRAAVSPGLIFPPDGRPPISSDT